jgi:hypothetical protein
MACSHQRAPLRAPVGYFPLKTQPHVYHDCDPGSMEVSEWYRIHVWYAMMDQWVSANQSYWAMLTPHFTYP